MTMRMIPALLVVMLPALLIAQMTPEEAQEAMEANKPSYEQLEADNARLRAQNAQLRMKLAAVEKKLAEIEAQQQQVEDGQDAPADPPAKVHRSIKDLLSTVPADQRPSGYPLNDAAVRLFGQKLAECVGHRLQTNAEVSSVHNMVQYHDAIRLGKVNYKVYAKQTLPLEEAAKLKVGAAAPIDAAIDAVSVRNGRGAVMVVIELSASADH
jgi:hypothetical protein